MSQIDRARTFHALHVKGDPLILYNIWDAGSAAAVAEAGARSVATGSWSVAAAHGYGDGEKIPVELLAKVTRRISETVELPLSVDFEGAYATDPTDAAENVSHILDAGAVGINFEDQIVGGDGLHSLADQAKRIGAIRAMAETRGVPLFINARTDLFLKESDRNRHAALLAEAKERAKAFADAGASGFFAPALVDQALIEELCEASPLPVNIMAMKTAPDATTLGRLGVARISHGPGPYRAAMAWLREAATAVYR
ncbi:isocitrate lyase/phosphoenolpyruvate mutase family protein [Nitratireductor kimnyeongensis]|uniref:Isocitrate lyase/phosphoenolpyruvate mutase family protein n=1 Tax=Nitratireductor kimnyeongensis TaxID=430679 RepID=A0ABW0T6X5_9HYPH|nr:isocitrate lyase/phosphoenolpyruvate mutase family protein [Nitratireductor kimnyeongensis]QZZ36381.1 isocitrate lyase/phosphoenolpyruvate mutase family protein [Nitratireductor kimnyeongensis]